MDDSLQTRQAATAIPDFVDTIFFHADCNPHKPAVVTADAVLTYGKLREGILSVQHKLARHGLKAGDHVAIHVTSAVAHIALLCGLYRAGIASVSLEQGQAQYAGELILDAILTSQPDSKFASRVIAVDNAWFNEADLDPATPNLAVAQDEESLCRLILSSGTTGRPKVIGLTFSAVRERLVSYAIRTSSPSWDRLLCVLGLGTNFGYSFVIMALWLGRTVCFAFDSFPKNIILRYQADLIVASTHQITGLVQAQEQNFSRFDSLRSIHIGGSVAYTPLQARIRMLVCSELYCGYGSTEGGTVAYVPAEGIFGMDRAVGITVPWAEVEIVDAERQPLPHGEEGEVRIRALGQGYRYVKVSEDACELANEEWFYPGDRGILYRNGVLLITGRINEMINRGGVKVTPEAIEEGIKQHTQIGDAGAVGVLDELGIEQIWVAVAARDGGELDIKQLFDYCREKMPLYIPDRIFQVPAIERNATGKIARPALSDQLKMIEANMALTVR